MRFAEVGDGGPPSEVRLLKLKRFVILRAERKGSYGFNGKKVRLESDFILEPVAPEAITANILPP